MNDKTRVAVLLILATCIFDAARDAVVCQWEWLPRHILKWTAFYPILVFVLFEYVKKWFDRVTITVVAFILWRLSYETFQTLMR